jgi:hypothetical protein
VIKIALPVVLAMSAISVFGSSVGTTPCTAGTLATYSSSFAPPSLGCSIGVLDYSNFSYQGLQNAPASSDIEVTPSGSGSNGFSFSQVGGAPFSASGEIIQFAIYYNIVIDPAPVIPGADTHLDPPVGNVSITEYFCNDLTLQSPAHVCFPGESPAYSLTVTTAAPNASVTFHPPATNFQTVEILFTLDGTHGTASFDGLDTNTLVADASIAPEPASLFLVGFFFLVAGGYRLKQQRNS